MTEYRKQNTEDSGQKAGEIIVRRIMSDNFFLLSMVCGLWSDFHEVIS